MDTTSDVYRYFIGHLGYLLMTDSWLIGSAGLLTILLLMVFRVPREEAALTEKFGDAYREYAMRTGKFLPRLGRGRTGSK
jgi:protein-S-isoprenylcysteine O-methyltransferase Ste14